MGGKNHAAYPKPMTIGPVQRRIRFTEVPGKFQENSLHLGSLFGRIFIVVGSFVSPLLPDVLGTPCASQVH
jgi:hypothetical protein